MESLTHVDKPRFYREEIRREFSLLAMRTTILVTCQTFLVVPYAIFNTAPRLTLVLVSIYLVAALGMFVALLPVRPLRFGRRTIDKWLIKQRALLQGPESLYDLAIDRDMIPGTDRGAAVDKEDVKSLAFSTVAPWTFCVFWCAIVTWSTIRVVIWLSTRPGGTGDLAASRLIPMSTDRWEPAQVNPARADMRLLDASFQLAIRRRCAND